MTQTAAEIWRKYAIQTVPASGPNTPDKAQIIAWGTWLESVLSGAEPESSIIRLTVTGGTANAIVATATDTPGIPGNKLYLLTPTAANTGATTIAVDGAPAAAIKNALGSQLAANSLLNDSAVVMMWSVDHYQIVVSVPVDATGVLADAVAARDAANGYSVAAASSASALGNQVHQYDTRALAIAATIPVGVQAIKITRYATGYPLSYATYIPGASTGPMAFQEAGGHWWQLDLSGGMVNVQWFGATGDDSTNNQTAMDAARAYCVTNNKTLGFPDGIYRHGSKNVWGYEKLKVHALGDKVVLKHTGTGVGNEFSGIALYPGSQGAAGGVFGGPNRFLLEGNAGTTDLVLVDNWHFAEMKIAGKNATSAILHCQDTGIVGASAVEVIFDIRITPNVSGTFAATPLYGILANALAACIFPGMVVEFVGNVAAHTAAVVLVDCNGNNFTAGTVESCLAGGFAILGDSHRNTFTNIHCESNGSQQDWTILGRSNIFVSCSGAGTTSGQYLAGNYNYFLNCALQSMSVISGATENVFETCDFLTAFSDGGTRTSVILPHSIVSPYEIKRGPLTIEAALAPTNGGVAGRGLNMSSTANFGVYFGSGEPGLQAAQGSLFLRTDGAGTGGRLYVNTNGATGWTAVTTAS